MATTIDGLDANAPLEREPVSLGDDEIRGMKTAIQGSFPNLGVGTVDVNATQIIHMYNRFSIGMVTQYIVPSGVVVLPEGWYPCDGLLHNGYTTPNLIDKQIKIAYVDQPTGTVGGLNSVTLVVAPVALLGTQLPSHSHVATINIRQESEGSDSLDESDGETGGSMEITLSTTGGDDTPEADPTLAKAHNHTASVLNNQPAVMFSLTAMYLGLTTPTGGA